MTYSEALIYIDHLDQQPLHPDLQNSINLMEQLGNPQNQMPVVHVAGTNGKGSTIAFMKSILIEGGYKVGTFTSPHILSPLELITINDASISEGDFAATLTVIQSACEALVQKSLPQPTVFEVLTAASLLYLSKANLDLAIIEVGLGGRYDATNVFQQPLLTVITKIDFDHTQWLGESLKEIAWHKGGIIKPKVPTVIAPNHIDVIEAISDIVRETGDIMYLMDEGFISEQVLMDTGYSKLFHLKSNFFDYKGLRTSMLGRHQTLNLATALLAIYQLRHVLPVDEMSIKKGIQMTKWTCRNDIISTKPLIMIDGGHNAGAIEAIAHLMKENFSNRKIITVFGVLSDKDVESMTKEVMTFSDHIFLTQPLSHRASDLSSKTQIEDVTITKDYVEALKKALSLMDDRALLLVLGSFYLAYPAKAWLMEHLKSIQ